MPIAVCILRHHLNQCWMHESLCKEIKLRLEKFNTCKTDVLGCTPTPSLRCWAAVRLPFHTGLCACCLCVPARLLVWTTWWTFVGLCMPWPPRAVRPHALMGYAANTRWNQQVKQSRTVIMFVFCYMHTSKYRCRSWFWDCWGQISFIWSNFLTYEARIEIKSDSIMIVFSKWFWHLL